MWSLRIDYDGEKKNQNNGCPRVEMEIDLKESWETFWDDGDDVLVDRSFGYKGICTCQN